MYSNPPMDYAYHTISSHQWSIPPTYPSPTPTPSFPSFPWELFTPYYIHGSSSPKFYLNHGYSPHTPTSYPPPPNSYSSSHYPFYYNNHHQPLQPTKTYHTIKKFEKHLQVSHPCFKKRSKKTSQKVQLCNYLEHDVGNRNLKHKHKHRESTQLFLSIPSSHIVPVCFEVVENVAARAAFKLLQIDAKFGFLSSARTVLDLSYNKNLEEFQKTEETDSVREISPLDPPPTSIFEEPPVLPPHRAALSAVVNRFDDSLVPRSNVSSIDENLLRVIESESSQTLPRHFPRQPPQQPSKGNFVYHPNRINDTAVSKPSDPFIVSTDPLWKTANKARSGAIPFSTFGEEVESDRDKLEEPNKFHSSVCSVAIKMDQFKGQPRLPKFAVPKRNDIRLKPDLIECRFSGSVAVNLEIVTATHFIILNAAELTVANDAVSFTNRDSSKVFKPSKVQLFEDDEILVLEFPEEIPIGLGVLNIQFDGLLNDRMKGFYRSKYEHNGEKRNMAVTQFEPADARRCFPCWDEPACKATFKITLDVPSDLVALSNMPIVEEKIDNNLKTVSYQESPIMSTYLVAVVVGLFDYVEDHTPDGVKVRVYCQVGKANQGKFALDVAVKTLGLYKDYFDTPYTLPKLDMIAIPDFAAGAMENYGLVTYRETALLYDDQHSAAANKQRVAIVVAHELAHQWFGNLVTMEWWTHLWLNEGFATWVSYLAADGLFPEWKIWSQFLHECEAGLRLDGLAGSHPIEVEINHAREIDEIFDAISYRKGASVIRMLQSYLGAESFQRSLASYIKRHACSNAKTEDLWAALEEGSGEPVNKLMTTWTKQQGYPVVSVKVNNQNLEFDQTQFLSSGAQGEGQWIVPITLCFGSYDVRKNFLFQTKSETRDVKELLGSPIAEDSKSWIKLNVEQAGFYRVKYDELLAAKLRYAIEKKLLSPSDRFGILDDTYALSMARKESLTSLLNLMGSYREEDDYTVLSNLISISDKVQRIAADAVPDLLDYFKQFSINVLQYSAERLGWDPKPGDTHDDALLRGEILTSLAELGHDLTLDEASRRFQAFLKDRNTPLLPPDIRRAVYVAVMKRATKSNRPGYESLLKVYRETDLSQEKTRILGSLSSSSDPDLILEVLNFMLSSEVRSQDAVFGLGVNLEGRDVAWAWLKENWEQISKTYGSGFLITRFVSATVSPFASLEKAKEVEEFFDSHPMPAIVRTLKQSLERVNINANWVRSVKNEKGLADVIKELAYRKY